GRRPPPQSIIVRELALTPEQTQKMNDIFHKTADTGHDLDEQRRSLRQKRDDDIRAIAKQEQNDKYDKILKDYTEASDKITEERRNIYTTAVEQTKLILNDDQRKHYEEIWTRTRWDGRGEGWPWPWGDRGGRGGPPGGRRPREGGRLNPPNQPSGGSDN